MNITSYNNQLITKNKNYDFTYDDSKEHSYTYKAKTFFANQFRKICTCENLYYLARFTGATSIASLVGLVVVNWGYPHLPESIFEDDKKTQIFVLNSVMSCIVFKMYNIIQERISPLNK